MRTNRTAEVWVHPVSFLQCIQVVMRCCVGGALGLDLPGLHRFLRMPLLSPGSMAEVTSKDRAPLPLLRQGWSGPGTQSISGLREWL